MFIKRWYRDCLIISFEENGPFIVNDGQDHEFTTLREAKAFIDDMLGRFA